MPLTSFEIEKIDNIFNQTFKVWDSFVSDELTGKPKKTFIIIHQVQKLSWELWKIKSYGYLLIMI